MNIPIIDFEFDKIKSFSLLRRYAKNGVCVLEHEFGGFVIYMGSYDSFNYYIKRLEVLENTKSYLSMFEGNIKFKDIKGILKC